jgi:hypothetical protein
MNDGMNRNDGDSIRIESNNMSVHLDLHSYYSTFIVK